MRNSRSLDRLQQLARWLNCPLLGLDHGSVDDFRDCVAQVSKEFRTLLIAGGDGSFAEAVNSLAVNIPLGFLPFGSGNALNYALKRRCSSPGYLKSILNRRWIPVRVMICNGHRKSLMAGVGLDSQTILLHSRLSAGRPNSFIGYGRSFFSALKAYSPGPVEIRTDNETLHSFRSLATIVSKHPFFGYGLKISQGFSLFDPILSLRLVEGSKAAALPLLATGLLARTPLGGRIRLGSQFSLTTDRERWLQCDGELIEGGREFTFELSPEPLRLII